MEKLGKIIENRILIFDGAMGTFINLIKPKNLKPNKYSGLNEYLNISNPELIEKIHIEYLKAGADVIETNTFSANPIILSEYGLEDKTEEINTAAVQIAKKAISNFEDKFIAGSIGPTNISLSLDSKISFDELKESYSKQVSSLVKAGVDILIFETGHDVLNMKAGLIAAFEVLEKFKKDIAVIASFTFDKNGLMLDGHSIQSAYFAIEHFPLFAFGLNCSTGPQDMAKTIEELSKISKFPTFIMPNAGLPDENGNYTQLPEDFSKCIKNYAEKGFVNIAGGCCGTNPKHISSLSEKLKSIKPRKINIEKKWIVSHIEVIDFENENRPLLIGERNNSIGSKKFREIVANQNFDEAILIAKNQVLAGAKLLDICFANPERDEFEDAKLFLPIFAKNIKIPVSIDTTNLKVAELACKIFSGKIIINSVNFESGIEKPLKAIKLNKKYGAKIVFGLIDENKKEGLPISSKRKLEIAKRAYKFMVIENKLKSQDLIFDALVFPAGLGGEYKLSAIETLKAIKELKNNFPEIKTILGISNVSFGLPPKAREILNSVFLYHAVNSGLDLAIVNVEKLKKYEYIPENERKMAEDLLFAKDDNAAKIFADYYREKIEKVIGSKEKLNPQEKLKKAILTGIKIDVEKTLDELLKNKTPLEIINGPVLETMAEIGKMFGDGKLIVTEVLASASVTKAIISYLQPLINKNDEKIKRGKILLATVRGDVHDIGKNLAGIIFESNGFEVYDLGIKVEPEKLIEAVKKYKPDFIGLSGLLVKSTEEMKIAAMELKKQKIKIPLILGGAALTEKFVEGKINPLYDGIVFYAADAMSGVNKALSYISGEIKKEKIKSQIELKEKEPENTRIQKKNTQYHPEKIFVPESLKRKTLKDFDIEILFENINWPMFNFKFLRAKNTDIVSLNKANKIIEEFKKEILEKKLIKANGVYQFFKTNSKGETVNIYNENGKLIEKFIFPRQNKAEFLSIADFILPKEKGIDYIAFFAVSCGKGISEISAKYRKEGDFIRSYLIESFALSLAEAFAEVIHYFIRKDWNIAENTDLKNLYKNKYQGKRYSFGYPSCPDLSNQSKLFKLIKPKDIGIKLTSNFMMEPEASVSGFALHNSKAKYFEI